MDEGISNYELGTLFISSIIGVGILSIPRRAVEGAGVDGLTAAIVAGLFFTLLAYIFSKLAVKFHTKTIIEFSESLVGKYLSRLIAFIFAIYFLTIVCAQVRNIAQSVKHFLLYNTPLEVIIISILLVSAIAVNYGVNSIARLSSNYVIFTMGILVIILLLSFTYFNIENLYPLFTNSLGKILQTAAKLAFDYIGFELVLFIGPLMAKPKSAPKITFISMMIVTVIYTGVTLISIGEFGVVPNQYIVHPTAIMTKAVHFTGFAERLDIFFILFWVIAAFTSMSLIWFLGAYSLSKIISFKRYNVFAFLLLPIVYTASLIPQNLPELEKLSNAIIYFAWFVVFPLVLLLYGISLVRKGGKKKSEAA